MLVSRKSQRANRIGTTRKLHATHGWLEPAFWRISKVFGFCFLCYFFKNTGLLFVPTSTTDGGKHLLDRRCRNGSRRWCRILPYSRGEASKEEEEDDQHHRSADPLRPGQEGEEFESSAAEPQFGRADPLSAGFKEAAPRADLLLSAGFFS
jgi:hypothetical protein